MSETNETYTTQTAYDVADRVRLITYPDNRAVIAYSYDDVGHLVKVESLWGTGANEVFYEAGDFNEIGQETWGDYGNGRTTAYEYYEHTRRLKRMVTFGDPNLQDISYTYDKASNIISVTDGVHNGASSCGLSNIQYDGLHRLVSLYSASEGRTITYEYDALGNILKNGEMGVGTYTYHATKVHAVTAANGNSYAYDACGNMTTRNRSGKPGQTLSYDEQNRLKQVAISGGSTVQFGYAAGGARLWKKVNGQITGLWIGSLYEEKDGKVLCHVYAGDRLVATFEPQSALACIVQNNRYLAAIWNNGEKALTGLFGHGRAPLSGMGLAILAGLGCGIVYSRRRLWLVHGLTSPRSGRLFRRQVLLTSLVGAILITSVPTAAYADTPQYDPVFYYYHPDHLGSCQLMTDRNGELVQQYGYTPFGEENYRNNTSAFEVSSRYTGQTLDEDTGLYYYGARYYDPELARFIQADSTVPDPEFSQAYNRYAYVYNNPLKFTDPTGQNPLVIIPFIIKGALIGGAVGAATSLIMGGDPAKGFLAGAIGGAFGGIGAFMNLGPVGMGLLGAAGGALGAAATGGDPVMGAITGGITAGVMAAMNFSPITSFEDLFTRQALKQLTISTGIGAMVGGVTAEMFGGNFSQGATYGAGSAAAGFVVGASITDFMDATSRLAATVLDATAQAIAYTLDISLEVALFPIRVSAAIVTDTVFGPVDEMTILGSDSGVSGSQRDITVKAYRLNELIGFSYVPRKDEIHVGKTVFNTLKAGRGYASHISHEIGHVFQRQNLGLAYYLTVVPLTFPANAFDMLKIHNTPFHIFENDATIRGAYGGLK